MESELAVAVGEIESCETCRIGNLNELIFQNGHRVLMFDFVLLDRSKVDSEPEFNRGWFRNEERSSNPLCSRIIVFHAMVDNFFDKIFEK